MSAPASICDINQWEEWDWYTRAHEVSRILQQKGFCLIKSNLDQKVKLGAFKEARAFKRFGGFVRVPLEAVGALFGESLSCWTRELCGPEETIPESETCLHKADMILQDIGITIAATSHLFFGMDLLGRAAGVLHHSKMSGDRPAPQLKDLDQAAEYIASAVQKKVTLLYYLGPSSAQLSVTPREDPERVYMVTIKSDVIIAFRNDACLFSCATRGFGIAVQVDFIARTRRGLLEAPKDLLPPPVALEEWYDSRLQRCIDTTDPNSGFPLDVLRDAKLSFFTKAPTRIRVVWYNLPAVLQLDLASIYPLQAALLRGLDPITEISSTRNASCVNWDIDEYFDEDPQKAVDFKMYTRHLSALHPDQKHFNDYLLTEFGIDAKDCASGNHFRMLCEAHMACLHDASLQRSDVQGMDVGLFMGIAGQHHGQDLLPNMKGSQFLGLSNPGMVNRLSYLLDCTGPSMTIDTEDSSGSVAVNSAVQFLQSEPDGTVGGLCAFASAISWVDSPLEMVVLCAAGFLSKTGRSRVFDETADGFVKGEGTVALLLEPYDVEEGDKKVPIRDRPLITGSAVNSRGWNSRFSLPNGTVLRDVVSKAANDAQTPFYLVDAVEVSAHGNPMVDLIEQGSLHQLLHTGDSTDEQSLQSVPLRALQSTFGNLGRPNGLASITRTCTLLEHGLHGPGLHLHRLQDISWAQGEEESSEFSSRMRFLTEVMEARQFTQIVGVSSLGSGTNAHQIIRGALTQERRSTICGKPVEWWPAGDLLETKPPLNGYFIVGTWTAWQECQPMEEEAEGVFGYTLTMGENNWECFQVWLDADSEQVLHPTEARSCGEVKIIGPDSAIGKELCWCISGETESVRLVNEEQSARMQNDAEQARRNGQQPHHCAVVFHGRQTPMGHEDAQRPEEMPLITINAKSAGKPGDKYRIRLHVRGKHKRLEWSRATGFDAISLPDEVPCAHTYQLIGDHNYWTFESMREDPSEPGLYTAEIHLLKDQSSFQIFRDGDWDQGFYPAVAASGMDQPIVGPDEYGHSLKWQIRGQAGDFYRIQFRRKVVQGKEVRSISWDYSRWEEVDFNKVAEWHSYFLTGSWTNFMELEKMDFDEHAGKYTGMVIVGRTGQESFQILLNSNWLAALHPSINNATCHSDEHVLEGPDDGGANRYWTIGLHPNDNVRDGDCIKVHLEMVGGLPKRVWWEKSDSRAVHRQCLASRCQRILQRHSHLLDL